MGFGINVVKHGENRGKYNAWYTLASTIVVIILLYSGGFFDCFIK